MRFYERAASQAAHLRRLFVSALAALVLATAALTPASLAADVTDVGFIDQSALSNLPAFASANRKLAGVKADLDRQFGARIRGVKSANDQARIAQEFQNKLATRQRDLFGFPRPGDPYWSDETLAEAEANMLQLTAERAQLQRLAVPFVGGRRGAGGRRGVESIANHRGRHARAECRGRPHP